MLYLSYVPQECVLQALLSLSDSGQIPPFCSVLILVRDLVSIPLPQVSEQEPQVDQSPQTQFSGKNNNYSKLDNNNLKWLNDSKNKKYSFYVSKIKYPQLKVS